MNQLIHREQWEYKRIDSSYDISEYKYARGGGPLDEDTLNELGKNGCPNNEH